MIRKVSISGLFAVCFVFGFGCASADDVAPSDDSQAYESSEGDSVEAEGDIGSVEQAITMPIVEPGPAQQCIAACTRIDVKNISGACCVCNGAVKKFVRSPTITNMYQCK